MAKKSISFRDVEGQYFQIMKDIEVRKYSPIYLLMGEETFFIDQISEKIATSVLKEEEKAFNQLVIYGKDSDGGTVGGYCRQIPMLGEYEVIIVKEAQLLDKIDLLSVYTANPQKSTILVLCYKNKTLDKRSVLYKNCLANGVVLECVPPREDETRTWAMNYIRSRGLTSDSNSVEILVNHVGYDLTKICNNIEKLVVAIPDNQTKITADDIEKYIGISKSFNTFELSNAIMRRDIKTALVIADNLTSNPKQNPLLLIIVILFSSFRSLFIAVYVDWEVKARKRNAPTDQELMALTKVFNFEAFRNMKANAKLWNTRSLFAVFGLLREYDGKSKGINTGGASEAELLRELLLKIMYA